MGTKAFMTLKSQEKEVYAFSKFDGKELKEYLQTIKEYGFPLS